MKCAYWFAFATLSSLTFNHQSLAQEIEGVDITIDEETEEVIYPDGDIYYDEDVDITIKPLNDWSGFYAGIQGAYAHLDGRNRFDETHGYNGGIGGLFGGYNYVIQNIFIGAEVEGNIWGFSGADGAGIELDSDYMLAATFRAGLIWEYILGYVDIGVATSRMKVRNKLWEDSSDKGQMTGWAAGGGVEVMVAENISLRADYKHIEYGSRHFTLDGERFKQDLDADIVRIGISYHF
ncbi:outer membrane protein [Flexibacterium corallicola]|uniref:outer membrane protein n=1 Tax=Flexibacterium corallicola TaxID=3037259 RepID=UPI00286F18F4|nr:outer membrane beta-barrel protein [Pseudovibrio sp. M1P-2-3]